MGHIVAHYIVAQIGPMQQTLVDTCPAWEEGRLKEGTVLA